MDAATAVAPLMRIVSTPNVAANLQLETLTALATVAFAIGNRSLHRHGLFALAVDTSGGAERARAR